MATVTLKNIPDELYELLKRSAELNHRSINSELIRCLERVLKPTRVSPSDRIARIRRLRPAGKPIDPEAIAAAIRDGRE